MPRRSKDCFAGSPGEGTFDLLKAEVNGRLDAFEGRLAAFEKNIELKISEAINTNKRWSIGMIAWIVTVHSCFQQQF